MTDSVAGTARQTIEWRARAVLDEVYQQLWVTRESDEAKRVAASRPIADFVERELAGLRTQLEQAQRERDEARADSRLAVSSYNEMCDLWNKAETRADASNLALSSLQGALRQLSDDEPCRFDHNGYCQTHSVTKPCTMAEARKALANSDHFASAGKPIKADEC